MRSDRDLRPVSPPGSSLAATIAARLRWALRRPSASALVGVLVCALFFACGIVQTAIVPLLPHLAHHYGLSASSTALVLALPGMAMLVVSVPAGVAADRFGARGVTLFAAALLAGSSVLQALPELAALLAGRIVFGVAFGVLWTAGVAWLSEMSAAVAAATGAPAKGRVGAAVVWSSVGTLVGPGAGGVLAERAGTGAPFLLDAVLTALILAGLLVCRRGGAGYRPVRAPDFAAATTATAAAAAPVADTPARARGPLGLAWPRLTRPRPAVLAAIGSLVVAGALSGGTQLLVTRGLSVDGLSTGRIGLIFSCCAVVYVAASAGTVRLGSRTVTAPVNAGATVLGAAALIPALLGHSTVLLVAALMLSAAPRGVINVTGYALPGRAAGSVFGLLNGAWAAASVLTPLAAGTAVSHGSGLAGGFMAVLVPTAAVGLVLCVSARTARPDGALSASCACAASAGRWSYRAPSAA